MPSTIDSILEFDVATMRTSASAALLVPPVNRFTPNIIPARFSTWTVESYHVFRGYPAADTDKGCIVSVDCGVTGWSNPLPPAREDIALGETARWLPLEGSSDGAVWSPHSGTSRIKLYSDEGMGPVLRTDFDYMRGDLFENSTSMNFQDGEFFYTQDVNFSDLAVSFAMVLLPRVPMDEEYPLIETGPNYEDARNGTWAGDGEFLHIGYTTRGFLNIQIGSDVVNSIQTATGSLRPSKPLIVGFLLSTKDKTLNVGVIDSSMHFSSHYINHPFGGQVWIGRSPEGTSEDAVMDVLDVVYWSGDMSRADFEAALNKLDLLYGVSSRINIQTAGDLA